MAYRKEFYGSTQQESLEKAQEYKASLDYMRQPYIAGNRVIHNPDGTVVYATAVEYYGLD